jgi:hypothetical protein
MKFPRAPKPLVCGYEMRLVGGRPHERFSNLDYQNFACDCYTTARDIVPRLDG